MLWRIVRRTVAVSVIGLLVVWGGISVLVEREVPSKLEVWGGVGKMNALILYHPSWLDRFQDDLTMAFGRGLISQGWSVERTTVSSGLDVDFGRYDLIVFGTNTYYGRPDYPTQNFLARVKLNGKPVAGLVSGAGDTEQSVAALKELIEKSGGMPVGVKAFWLFRPNDESRMDESNISVAFDSARAFGAEIGRRLIDLNSPSVERIGMTSWHERRIEVRHSSRKASPSP